MASGVPVGVVLGTAPPAGSPGAPGGPRAPGELHVSDGPGGTGPTALPGLAPWSRAIRVRLDQIEAVRRRTEGLAGPRGCAGTSRSPSQPHHAAAERDLVVRTLRVLGDPMAFQLLAGCVDSGRSVEELVDETSLPAVAIWERVNDLVQVALLERHVDTGRVGATLAGQAVHQMVESVVELAAASGTPVIPGTPGASGTAPRRDRDARPISGESP